MNANPEEFIEYTDVDTEALKNRVEGSDFKGNLTEFQLTFEWRWASSEAKLLYEKKSDKPYSGTLAIKDERLDPDTYPSQGQKIKFTEGKIEFFKSLEGPKGNQLPEGLDEKIEKWSALSNYSIGDNVEQDDIYYMAIDESGPRERGSRKPPDDAHWASYLNPEPEEEE